VPSRPAQAAPPNDQVEIAVTGDLAGITANPTLSPGFSTSIKDYVVRCRPGVNNVSLRLVGAGTITVGAQSGPTVTITVALRESQAVVVTPSSQGVAGQYWIRCLPQDFPQMTFNQPGNPPPGWYLTGTLFAAGDGSSALYA